MLTVFWDSQGVLLAHFQKYIENMNYASYFEVLLKLRDAIRRKCPGHLLHRGNARPHTVRATQKRIQELKWELLEHLTYSADLVPSDFHLFGPLSNQLCGKYFTDDEDVETEVRKWLRQQSKDFYAAAGKAIGQVDQCWWRVCREIDTFPSFEYHMFCVLYPFVTLLMTLPLMHVTFR
jgi:hypothetical protein